MLITKTSQTNIHQLGTRHLPTASSEGNSQGPPDIGAGTCQMFSGPKPTSQKPSSLQFHVSLASYVRKDGIPKLALLGIKIWHKLIT